MSSNMHKAKSGSEIFSNPFCTPDDYVDDPALCTWRVTALLDIEGSALVDELRVTKGGTVYQNVMFYPIHGLFVHPLHMGVIETGPYFPWVYGE